MGAKPPFVSFFSKGQRVKKKKVLIPEAAHRETVSLMVGVAVAGTAEVVIQGLVPGEC